MGSWLARLRILVPRVLCRQGMGVHSTKVEILNAYCPDCGGITILRDRATRKCWCPQCEPMNDELTLS